MLMQPLKTTMSVLRPMQINKKREAKVAKKFTTPMRAVIEVEEISRPLKRMLE